MIETQTVVGTLLGIASGVTPFIVHYLWREFREWRIEKAKQAEREHEERMAAHKINERQAEREHRERMQEMNNQHTSIQLGIQRDYAVDAHSDSITFHPQAARDTDPRVGQGTNTDKQDRPG